MHREDMDLKEQPPSPSGRKQNFSRSSSAGSLYMQQAGNASGSSSGHGNYLTYSPQDCDIFELPYVILECSLI